MICVAQPPGTSRFRPQFLQNPMPATDEPLTVAATPLKPRPLTAPAVLEAYRRMTPIFNRTFGFCSQSSRRRAVAVLQSQPGDRILDVGIGRGMAPHFWHPEAEVHGIDLSPHMPARDEAQNLK